MTTTVTTKNDRSRISVQRRIARTLLRTRVRPGRSEVRIAVEVREFFPLNIHPSAGTHTVSYSRGAEVVSQG